MIKLLNKVAPWLMVGAALAAPVAIYVTATRPDHVIMRAGTEPDFQGTMLGYGDVGIEFDAQSNRLLGARVAGNCGVELRNPVNGKYESGLERCVWPRRGFTQSVVTPDTRPQMFSAVNTYAVSIYTQR